MWELAKIASIEYPLLDHRDLLRLCSCNVGRQRISASWDRFIANSFISGICGVTWYVSISQVLDAPLWIPAMFACDVH